MHKCTIFSKFNIDSYLGCAIVDEQIFVALGGVWKPGGSVRGERAIFTRLVLGCIEAKFCK